MPSTPRGWLNWVQYVLASQSRPFSPRYDGMPRGDPRLCDSRETALSVKILAEKSSHKVCGNGVGYELLRRFYAGEAPWASFTRREQNLIAITARDFARRLREAGFIDEGAPTRR